MCICPASKSRRTGPHLPGRNQGRRCQATADTEFRYTMVELELAAVEWAKEKCRVYLPGLPSALYIIIPKPARWDLLRKLNVAHQGISATPYFCLVFQTTSLSWWKAANLARRGDYVNKRSLYCTTLCRHGYSKPFLRHLFQVGTSHVLVYVKQS